MKLSPVEQIFLDLVAIDEVHPHEAMVTSYISSRLEAAGIPYRKDQAGNIVATIKGQSPQALALVGHTDIAAPLGGRQVVVEPEVIKTDGTGLLGGDDKAAVAALLGLAQAVKGTIPPRTIELIFTVGEEAGCVGAVALDMNLVSAKEALVLDWTGRVNRIVTNSPAYLKVDVEYIGINAHPAHWQDGRNAGAALIEAASQLRVGEYAPGVTCNIGIFSFGEARNQVPGRASLQAEVRSHDGQKVDQAAAEIKELFTTTAAKHQLQPVISLVNDSPAYTLNPSGSLFQAVTACLGEIKLKPVLEPTFGGFDANVLAARGIDVVILGAAYYNPHSPSEYLSRPEFAELSAFLTNLCL